MTAKQDATSSSAADLLADTARSGPYDQEEDDPILATLKRSPPKKRNPNSTKWDGRVQGMTLQEYRNRKWGMDIAYAKTQRGGPTYSFRKPLPNFLGRKSNNFVAGDVMRSFSCTLPGPPEWTMGVQTSCMNPDIANPKSQGPAEYQIKSTMDPSPHPSLSKNCGARFGSEVLDPRDPTGPAPGDYDANAILASSHIKRPPNYSCQGREAWAPRTTAPGPGIGEYADTVEHQVPIKHGKMGLNGGGFKNIKVLAMRTGKSTPTLWNMQGRTEPLAKPLGQRQYESPSPAHYNGPGAGASCNPTKNYNPVWKFGTESRGLRN